MKIRGCPVCKSEDPDMWNRCDHPGCPDGRTSRHYVDDPNREQPPMPSGNLNGNAKTFVKATEVITEYQRGLRDGILRREMLAVSVMDFTVKVERHNIDLDIENQWLRYQRAGWMIISICFFVAFMVVVLH